MERVYNAYSGMYDWVFGKVFQSGREMAPALLNLSPGVKLLDVGIGTGLSLPLLSKKVEITGVDLSQKMLEKAEKRVRTMGLKNVRLMKMDATKLDFPDNSFDRVLAAYFISTVPEPIKVVEEMKRVCRPGGYLVFINHFQNDNPVIATMDKIISPLCYRVGFKTDLNLHQLMKATHLEIETLERVGFMGYWRAVRCLNPRKDTSQTPE